MSVSCKIIRDNFNNVIGVESNDGRNSILYEKALQYFNNQDEALKAFVIGYSDSFKDFFTDEFGNVNYKRDVNNEPEFEEVLSYLKSTEENKLNEIDKMNLEDFRNIYNFQNYDELKEKLYDTFLDKEGNFYIDETKIKNSQLYSEKEIINLLENVELQNKIKNNIYALKNYSPKNNSISNNFLNITRSNSFNNFGKENIYDSYDLLKSIISSTYLSTDENEFDEYLKKSVDEEIYNTIYNNEFLFNKLYEIVSNIKKIEVKKVEDGNLINVKEKDTFNELKSTLILSNISDDLVKNLNTLSNLDYDVLLNNFNDVSKILSEIEKELIKSNIDVIGLSENFLKHEIEKSHSFIRALRTFINSINSGHINDFVLKTYSDIYNDYFGIEDKVEYINIDSFDGKPVIKLNEELSDIDAFKNNLLKVNKDYYLQIDKKSFTDNVELITEEYLNNNNLLNDILPNNLKSDISIKNYIENIVQEKLKNSKEKVTEDNISEYKNLYLLKLINNITDSENFNKNTSLKKIDYDYLSDLNNVILLSKYSEHPFYNKVFKYIRFLNDGLIIDENKEVVLDRIDNLLPSNKLFNTLKEYFKEEQTNLSDREVAFYNRENINFINKEDYKIIDKDTIVSNINKEFLKTDNDIFEKIDDDNGLVTYSRLVRDKNNIKLLSITKVNENVEVDKMYEFNNHYSVDEKNKLLEEINNCN